MQPLLNVSAATSLGACLAACGAESYCFAQWDATASTCKTVTLATASPDATAGVQIQYKLPPITLIAASSVDRQFGQQSGAKAKMLASGYYAYCSVPDSTAAVWASAGSNMTRDARTFARGTAAWDSSTDRGASCRRKCDNSNVCWGFLYDASTSACLYRGGVDALATRSFFVLPGTPGPAVTPGPAPGPAPAPAPTPGTEEGSLPNPPAPGPETGPNTTTGHTSSPSPGPAPTPAPTPGIDNSSLSSPPALGPATGLNTTTGNTSSPAPGPAPTPEAGEGSLPGTAEGGLPVEPPTPCTPNPCTAATNSAGVCTPVSGGLGYSCSCTAGYTWDVAAGRCQGEVLINCQAVLPTQCDLRRLCSAQLPKSVSLNSVSMARCSAVGTASSSQVMESAAHSPVLVAFPTPVFYVPAGVDATCSSPKSLCKYAQPLHNPG